MTTLPKHFSTFAEFRDAVLQVYLDYYPTFASTLGLHKYDALSEDFSIGRRQEYLNDLFHAKELLETTYADSRADAIEQFERKALFWKINEEIFRITELREYEWNPMFYDQSLELSHLLDRDYCPLSERLQSVRARLRAVPSILAVARQNILPMLDRTVVETAINTFAGRIEYYDSILPRISEGIPQGLAEELEESMVAARMAVESFLEAVRSVVLPLSRMDTFMLGKERLKTLVERSEMVYDSIDELKAAGEQELNRLTSMFVETAHDIDDSLSAAEVFRTYVESDHFSEKNLIPETRKILVKLRDFIKQSKCITLPSDAVCDVRETPEHMRWAFAAMDSPGAFETKATEAFYYITPPEKHWDDATKHSYMNGFNRSVLEIISIHEAFPGHYVHFLHLQKASSKVGKTFWCYGFIEGWAHYAEEMLLDEGWGENDARLRLAFLQEALIRICRYLASIGKHTGAMTVEECKKLFEKKAMMNSVAAKREAERAVFDPSYMFYSLGKLQIKKLRKRAQKQRDFNLHAFHDELLSYGCAPVSLIGAAMYGTPEAFS